MIITLSHRFLYTTRHTCWMWIESKCAVSIKEFNLSWKNNVTWILMWTPCKHGRLFHVNPSLGITSSNPLENIWCVLHLPHSSKSKRITENTFVIAINSKEKGEKGMNMLCLNGLDWIRRRWDSGWSSGNGPSGTIETRDMCWVPFGRQNE